mgnify:CR=1 FL=1
MSKTKSDHALDGFHAQLLKPDIDFGVRWELTRAEYYRGQGDIEMSEYCEQLASHLQQQI